MDDIDYNEIVSLIRPGTGSQAMTLAEAVRTIIHTEDKVAKAAFGITRDGKPSIIGRR